MIRRMTQALGALHRRALVGRAVLDGFGRAGPADDPVPTEEVLPAGACALLDVVRSDLAHRDPVAYRKSLLAISQTIYYDAVVRGEARKFYDRLVARDQDARERDA